MARHNPGRAFTLMELLVVFAILSALIAVLLPAIQMAREAGRRSACQNNLRQVGLALQNFEGTHNEYPIGARCQIAWPSGVVTIGTSWWVEILPQLEQSALAAKLDVTGPYPGWVVLNPQNGRVVDGVTIASAYCPSSPIPLSSPVGGFQVAMPSYVGISGGANGDGFVEDRVSVSSKNGDEFAAGGLLIPNEPIHRREVEDGTSHTLFVGEASDYCLTKTGSTRRIDAGFPNGWLAGTSAVGKPQKNDSRFFLAYNITTVRYPIGTRIYELPGVNDDRGGNNPLLSAHPGGAEMLFADGSVQFLVEDTHVLTLKRLATRDDGDIAER
jgi:prepilin-type processing-associated H-X9-DG protein